MLLHENRELLSLVNTTVRFNSYFEYSGWRDGGDLPSKRSLAADMLRCPSDCSGCRDDRRDLGGGTGGTSLVVIIFRGASLE